MQMFKEKNVELEDAFGVRKFQNATRLGQQNMFLLEILHTLNAVHSNISLKSGDRRERQAGYIQAMMKRLKGREAIPQCHANGSVLYLLELRRNRVDRRTVISPWTNPSIVLVQLSFRYFLRW